MEFNVNDKFGYWSVNNQKFYSKIDAFIYASKINSFKINFHYYDDIWENYNRSLIGVLDLEILYKNRAQQLRDKYDYLILNYSGGADSHNILISFLKNNIRLDAVYIKWPFTVTKSYKSFNDSSPINFLSEWELTIKERLKWLSINYPNVRILTDDWSTKIFNNNLTFENNLHLFNHLYSIGDVARITTRSQFEIDLINLGKNVGTIWGIDKPYISLDLENNFYFKFRDHEINIAQSNNINKNGTELFYWSPESPQIIFEQSYRILSFFKNNPEFSHLIRNETNINQTNLTLKYRMLTDVINFILYKDWDPSWFQANKDFSPSKMQWDNWIYNSAELTSVLNSWKYSFDNLTKTIDNKLTHNYKGKKLGLKVCETKKFLVGKI